MWKQKWITGSRITWKVAEFTENDMLDVVAGGMKGEVRGNFLLAPSRGRDREQNYRAQRKGS